MILQKSRLAVKRNRYARLRRADKFNKPYIAGLPIKARRRRAYLFAKFLMRQKHFRILRLKENQPHFLQLQIIREKFFNGP